MLDFESTGRPIEAVFAKTYRFLSTRGEVDIAMSRSHASAATGSPDDDGPARIEQLGLRGFKSFRDCTVPLSPFSVIVGRNGSGKSNFLDAVRFVAGCLDSSLTHQTEQRGGFYELTYRGPGPSNGAVRIAIQICLPGVGRFEYSFSLWASALDAVVSTVTEKLIEYQTAGRRVLFETSAGEVRSDVFATLPEPVAESLYLKTGAGLSDAVQAIFRFLSAPALYDLVPALMKKTSEDRYANRLDADGSNLAAMFRFLSDSQPSVKERLLEFLRAAIEGVADVRCEPFGRGIELRFDTQRVGNESATLWRPGEPDGSNGPLHRASGTSFYASQMSDGTLRTLGMLVAVFGAAQSRPPVSFVSIEEPETALHPHATAVLVDAFREVSRQTQVVITTHSPCLLDDLDPDLDGILVAQSIDGQTRMGPIDAASRETIRQGLFSAGQLLDMNQLEPSHIAQSTGA